jgi:hypothetical protein
VQLVVINNVRYFRCFVELFVGIVDYWHRLDYIVVCFILLMIILLMLFLFVILLCILFFEVEDVIDVL